MSLLGIDTTVLRVGSLGALILALALAAVVLHRFSSDENGLVGTVKDRFVLGVPWGTLVVVALVYAIYYLVQGGGQRGGPIVVGFRSWSYWYPQSMLFSSFTHSSHSHLMGNLFGTLAFAPIVEYAWGHYPRSADQADMGKSVSDHGLGSRESRLDRYGRWLEHPAVRIGTFVGVVFVVGIVGSLIVPGAAIGFSGVVFAFAGFALVTFPIAAVLAIVGIQVVRLVYRSFTDPFVLAQAQERFVRPSWADVAVQGHLYGLLIGVLLALVLLRYRDHSPNLRHVFFAVLVFAVSRSLQSIYWFLGNEGYVLFQALGTAGVILLATIIAVATIENDRLLVSRIDLRVSTAVVGFIVALVLALALLGVPYNLVSVTGGEEVEDGIEIQDYTVTYAEGVENKYISALDLPVYQGPSVRMSGVIVVSEKRNVWERSVSREQLEIDGSATVVLGDATWRETVRIQRTQWTVAGGNISYQVFGRHDGAYYRLFESDLAVAQPTIDGKTIAIQPAASQSEIVVVANETVLGVEPVPADGKHVQIENLSFERENNRLFVAHERTELLLAEYST